jgi:hypothetical protein
MGNFSKPPLDTLISNLDKGYVGLRIEQGVPLLDRDVTLLNDLISATVRAVVSRYIGDGVAAGSEGFAIAAIPADNDFRILAGTSGPGTCLVGGIEVTIEADVDYSAQAGVPALTTPDATQPDPREDTVFLDVWLEEVDSSADADLLNTDDVGVQTSVRLKPEWQVRVAEGVPVPAPDPGHTHYPLALLTRPRNEAEVQAGMITDLREPMSPLTEVERRLAALETLLLLPTFAAPGSQFSPVIGTEDTLVTLFGTNFNVGTPVVLFGAVTATLEGPPTATEIQVRVPAGLAAGPINITVTTDGGTVVSDDQFTVLDLGGGGDAPAFAAPGSQFSPVIGTINTLVTLSGTNFDVGTAVVQFGAVTATLEGPPTATEIQVRVPAGLTAGPVNITVTTDGGTVTSDDTFTVL